MLGFRLRFLRLGIRRQSGTERGRRGLSEISGGPEGTRDLRSRVKKGKGVPVGLEGEWVEHHTSYVSGEVPLSVSWVKRQDSVLIYLLRWGLRALAKTPKQVRRGQLMLTRSLFERPGPVQ